VENLIKAANPDSAETPAERLKKIIDQKKMEQLKRMEADNAASRKEYADLKAQGPQDKLALQLGLAADLFNVDGNRNNAATAQKVLAMDPREQNMASLKQAMKGQESALSQAYNSMAGNDQLALEKLRQKGTLSEIQARKKADIEVAKVKGSGTNKGFDKLDTEKAKSLNDYMEAKPGLLSNVDVLNKQLTILKDNKREYGNKPFNYDYLNTKTDQEAQQIKETIDSLTVETLKPLLGGAFSEKENELIRALAYNPMMSNAHNAERLQKSLKKIAMLMQSKDEAYEYFMGKGNGSMRGYKGYTGKDIDKYMKDLFYKNFEGEIAEVESNKANNAKSKDEQELDDFLQSTGKG
jgi:hypothetical protein